MTNTKSTKRSLLASVMALFLCFTMLLGTTFAWFTDSVTSGNNIIKSGNLDIELEYWNGTDWADVKDASDILTNTLWEPGVTEVAYLRIANAGSLVLKYQFGVNILKEIEGKNQKNETFKLSDYIMFGVVEGVNGETAAYAKTDAGRTAAIAAVTDAKKISAGYTKASTMNPNEELYLALVVYMPTTNTDNVANHNGTDVPQIDLGINVLATQMTAENDSFDDQYDKGAWHPDFTVTSVEDLAAALANGGKIQVNGTLNAGATQDVPNWTNAPAEFIFDATTLDALKGGKYVLEQGSRYGVVGLISAGESLALSDMEITANSQWPVYLSNYGGTLTLEDIDVTATQGAGIYPYGTNGTTTIKSANVNQKALSDEFASSTPWAGTAIATSNGHNLIIEDGTYVGSTWGVYVYNSGANVTINGGTFKAPKVIQADGVWSTGGNKSVVTVNDGNFDGALYLDWGTTPPEIYINGGNFTNFSATVNGAAKLVIKGGTFDADPSAYVAEGYKAVETDGKYVVVSNTVKDENVVDTAAELATAIANGGEVVLAADIDMNNAWASVVPANGLIILGNGKTITNLNQPLLAGKGGPVVTVKDLTIADSNVGIAANENDLGTGAFLSFADYSGDVVFEDCHLLNSTVTGNERAAAFVGYSQAEVTIKDCSVEGCTIQAVGSTAALIGHASKATVIENTSVTNTKVTATEDRTDKAALAGSLIGTVAGNTTLTNVTTSNNTVSNNGATPVSAEIGRIVSASLTIDGAVVVTDSEKLQAAINSGVGSILLGEGEFTADLYVVPANRNLTITGQGAATKLNFKKGQVRLEQFDSLTISNCTIGRMVDKKWGQLVFSTSNNAGGVYTISDCIFDGVGTQGVYINENISGAIYNIKNCTFNGDFGGEGAITIQNNEGVNVTVNVTECDFNNIPETSHEIFLIYASNTDGWTLNAEGVEVSGK